MADHTGSVYRRHGFAGLIVALGILVGDAAAQYPGAGLSMGADADGVSIAGCSTPTLSLPLGSLAPRSIGCGVPGVTGAEVVLAARALAPSVFDPSDPASYRLAEVGAAAKITSRFRTYPGSNAPPGELYAPPVNAYSSASFRDYLQLATTRPDRVEFQFDLHGVLAIGPELTSTSGLDARVIYTIQVQSGVYSASDGTFGSFATFAAGSVAGTKSISAPGGVPLSDVVSNGPIFYVESPHPTLADTKRVTLRLGSGFFSNPANDDVLLDIGLSAIASAPAVVFGGPVGTDIPQDISADFDSTLVMVGLKAFDASGNDITADAIIGFQSVSAVPEPRVYALLLSGLVITLVAARRGRRAT